MMLPGKLRGGLAGACVLGLLVGGARAQNGSNYHVLNNGFDVMYAGVGAGGTQTKADGLGTWISGEDLRGSHLTPATGDFGYRLKAFRERACVGTAPSGAGPLALKFRGIFFVELDGLNAHQQAVFTNPACPLPGPSFPLGNASGFIPYGVGPGASASFVVTSLPSNTGPAPSSAMVLPNNGLVPGAGGFAELAFDATDITLPISSTGFCWSVQFSFLPSSVGLTDDIDGLWHYLINSDDGNQYWGFSDDELNLWQSNSVASSAQLADVVALPANADYDLLLLSVEPNTIATLAPVGAHQGGAYYHGAENVQNAFGVKQNPNRGFDAGRGSAAISFRGAAGVPNPTSGLGNQNPLTVPGTTPTLGFMTWDNGGDNDGSVRLTWLSVDVLQMNGGNPDIDPGVLEQGGTIRVPVVSAGLIQPVTEVGFRLFTHVTLPGWPDPSGFPSGAFGVPGIGGASWQIPTAQQPPACYGMAVNITYGTSGFTGVLGAPGSMTFDPSIADTSGSKELYLFD